MKKLLITLGLVVTAFVGTASASIGVCNLSEADIATIEEIAVLFDTYAEEKIVKKHFATEEYRNLVRIYTESGVSTMRTIREICLDGRQDAEGASMIDMEYRLQEYIYTILKLKEFEKNHSPNDVMFRQSVVMQSHLIDVLGMSGKNTFSEYRFSATMNVSSEFDENENVKLAITTSGEGFGDKHGEVNEGSFTIGVDGKIDGIDTKAASLSADMNIDLRMKGGETFIKIHGFDFNVDSLDIDFEDREDIDQFINSIKLIEGKWIAIPSSIVGVDGAGMGGGMFTYLELTFGTSISELLSEVPILMTYSEEGGVYYGGPSPLFCGVMMQDDIGACIDEIQQILEESQGKGFITMQPLKGSYSMGLSDKYVDEGFFSEEMSSVLNKPIVRWNNEKITRVSIELPEYGEALYDNGNIHIDLSTDVESYDWETDSIFTEELSVKADGAISPEYIQIDIDINSPDLSMEISLESFQELIGPRTVTLPDESEVIALESLLY